MVEREDEFRRIRTTKISEVPKNLVLNQEDEVDEDEYVDNLFADRFDCQWLSLCAEILSSVSYMNTISSF